MGRLLWLFSFLLSPTLLAGYDGTNPVISADELLTNRDKYLVLDVRSNDEFAEGNIEGAINIPHYAVLDHLEQFQAWQDKIIIVHCRSGKRAWKAEQMLMKQGISNLAHLEGDMLGWQKAKRPIVKPEQN